MNNEALILIKGGATISGTLLSSIAKLINTFLEMGRSIGSALRMIRSGKKC